jgi:hypothetical protein
MFYIGIWFSLYLYYTGFAIENQGFSAYFSAKKAETIGRRADGFGSMVSGGVFTPREQRFR